MTTQTATRPPKLNLPPVMLTLHHYRTGVAMDLNATQFNRYERTAIEGVPATFVRFVDGDRVWVREAPSEITAAIRVAVERVAKRVA